MRRTVTVLLLVSCLGGCGPGESESSPDPRLSAERKLPLTSLVEDLQRDLILLDRAMDVPIQHCMEDKGWEYFPVGLNHTRETAAFYFQVLTPEEAAREGYAVYLGREPRLPDAFAEQEAYLQALSPQERDAWERDLAGPQGAEDDIGGGISVPTEGCLAEAREEVWGEQWREMSTLGDELQLLQFQVESRVEADERFQEALARWQDCMADRGYRFEQPQAAVASVADTRPDEPSDLDEAPDRAAQSPDAARSQNARAEGVTSPHAPTSEEIEIATADAECRQDSQLSSIDAELRTQFQAEAVSDHEEQLLQWQELREEFLPRVRELLGDAAVDQSR